MELDFLYNNTTKAPILHHHFRRARIGNMLAKAIHFPLITITAGGGYGKTQAVSAYLEDNHDILPIWLRLSELDNLPSKFWESFVYAASVQNKNLSQALRTMKFPDSAPLFHLFLQKLSDARDSKKKPMLILDDFHLINDPSVKHFIENLLIANLKDFAIIIISRTEPQLDVKGFFTTNRIYQITQADLCFSLEEIKGYFEAEGLTLQAEELMEIYDNTEGWVSAIYLVLLSLKKEGGGASHALISAKPEIYKLIEREIFSLYPAEIQKILIQLSFLKSTLIHINIVKALSDNLSNLINEIEKTNMFIQFDPLTESYRIHHLFLDFLLSKQRYCSNEEKKEIYYLAAHWHHRQGALIEALEYYKECGHYEEIWDIIRNYTIDLPSDEATLLLSLIEKFPDDLLKKYPVIGVVHGRLLLNNGRLKEAIDELSTIKETYEALPPTPENKAVIGEACIFLAMISLAMKNYDFVELFKKADECLPNGSVFVDNQLYLLNGNFSIPIESPAAGEVKRFEDAIIQTIPYASRAMNGCSYGTEYVTSAEVGYYTGDTKKAESNAYEAIYKAAQQKQHDLVCVSYFTLIRTSIAKGHYQKATDLLNELVEKVEKPDDVDCFAIIEFIKGWFYARLGDMDKVPKWILNEEQSEHMLSPNRTGRDRLLRAYCLLESENYYNLLAFLKYLEDLYGHNSFLIPRLHIQIFKSIAAKKIGNIEQSMTAFQTAYDLAHANSLITPFIEMGLYMRAVCDTAKRWDNMCIPNEWLDMICTKACTYAKQLRNVRVRHNNSIGAAKNNLYKFTKREREVLQYLCQGLKGKEIADLLYISMNTVKRITSNIYNKMGAANKAEAINLAAQSGVINID